MARRGRLRIGTSGYQYPHWRGGFYPETLAKREWFGYYARHFDSVEINNTFYQLPQATTFDHWRAQAPAGFCYALKFSRYATHLKHLKDPRPPLRAFVRRAERLRELLGPILVQLPPHWHVDVKRLAGFLDAAPPRHRWAIEFRDRSWLCDEVYALLRAHGAALCVHDLLDDHPRERTANWVYQRFHGVAYDRGYTPQRLRAEAQRIRGTLDAGGDVFVYFNNDRHGHAVRAAAALRRFVAAG
jgi:uncharacterized protein YecE (DUF72 family)